MTTTERLTTSESRDDAISRAEARFKRKEAQRQEGARAMADYERQGRAIRERTARLRALRLAREATRPAAKGKPVTGQTPS